MDVNYNIKNSITRKQRLITVGVALILTAVIGLAYAWVTHSIIGESNTMSLSAASISFNYRGTSPTILAHLAPGETVEKTFEVINEGNNPVSYNLTWENIINTFNPESDLVYSVSERTLGELVSPRVAPSSNLDIYYNLVLAPGETHFLSLTITFVLDKERDQSANIGNYFSGDITVSQSARNMINYTEIYLNDEKIEIIPPSNEVAFDDKRSWCTDGSTISYNTTTNELEYENLTNSTTCKAYFNTEILYVKTGNPEIFTVPTTGNYKIELWGAMGGANSVTGGSYTKGIIELEKNKTLYFYVGGAGAINALGGYNGGGNGSSSNATPYSGGGSTDVRYEVDSINSRIMVAGAGSGGSGAATAGAGLYNSSQTATQTSAVFYQGPNLYGGVYNCGDWNCWWGAYPGNGGGGGYWAPAYIAASASYGGGSSYISGHTGCVAIESSESTAPKSVAGGVVCETGSDNKECSIHYSNKEFSETLMIDGAGYTWTNTKEATVGTNLMPNPLGGNYASGGGNTKDGYAKITYISNNPTYSLTLDLKGGTQSKDYNGEYYEGYIYQIETPIKFGHIFGGWTIEGIGSTIDENGLLKVGESNMKLTAMWGTLINFTFVEPSGGEQTYPVPETGTYKLEVWGGQGGSYNEKSGGRGAYSVGEINIDKSVTPNLYIGVGGEGGAAITGYSAGGYNGGGSGYNTSYIAGGGGGATHIATRSGILSSLENYKSSILIVAGGGGGAGTDMTGGHGGGKIGVNASGACTASYGVGATQTAGGDNTEVTTDLPGSFGMGGTRSSSGVETGVGGGGGYYGGSSGTNRCGGGGGSGYIQNLNSGTRQMYTYCTGTCTAYESSIDETKTTTGNCVNATATANCAKSGNGYARITYLGI